jgi:predicted PurR-regulated permease PerM
MLDSRKAPLAVSLVSKAMNSTRTAIPEAGHLPLTVIAMGVVVAVLYLGRVIFITSIVAITIAFILDPFVRIGMRLHMPRSVSSFVVCSLALLFLYVMGMGAYSQMAGLWDELPKYGQRIGELVETVTKRVEGMEERSYRLLVPARQREVEAERARQQQAAEMARKKKRPIEVPPLAPPLAPSIPEVRIHEERTPVGDYIYSRLSSFYQILLMASFVPFLVYFMLSWRDHMNRSFLQFFHGEDRLVAARSMEGIAEMVRAFVVGNFILGLLLAALSSAVFWIIRLPYPLLVGPLSGALSLVPYVGLPLALIPPMFAALGVNVFSVYVLVFAVVATLHMLALNLLYPKIVGSRVHLNPLVVTFSLMIWGFLWDAPGLLLAIPLTAGIKAVCDNVRELRPFGKFLGD